MPRPLGRALVRRGGEYLYVNTNCRCSCRGEYLLRLFQERGAEVYLNIAVIPVADIMRPHRPNWNDRLRGSRVQK